MQTDHVKMLYDIGELNNLFTESVDTESFLQRIVEMVSRHMSAEVCSIYIYDEAEDELVLKAAVGMKSGSLNNVRIKHGEGLVGLSLKEAKPICEKCISDSPHYQSYNNTINEDIDQSFLAVPMIRGNIKIGVLVVQRSAGKVFADQDIMALRITASQLASMIENIRFIISPHKYQKAGGNIDLDKFKFIRGKKASEGFAYSRITILDSENIAELYGKLDTAARYTVEDFNMAVKATEGQLEKLQEKIEEKLEDAASLIFSAHLLMLKDENFTGSIREMIEKGENPPAAIIKKFNEFRDAFLRSSSQIIREKVQDIEDLTRRLLNNLEHREGTGEKFRDMIAVARDIYPSDLLTMSAEEVAGVILVSGGVTSHVSILARSLKIPVVIANIPELLELPDGTMALLDAEVGHIFINPAGDIVARFRERNDARREIGRDPILKQPSLTKDGRKIKLMININLLSDLKNIEDTDNDGIGLYRTEFPFIIRNDFPTEEEQFVIYSRLAKGMKDKPVTFRTLDIGGDKVLSYYQVVREENPFLGMRSIRFSLTHKDIFKQQIRAILRAGYGSNVRIMFPMISSLDEFLVSRDIVHECIHELSAEKTDHISDPEIGMMVEIPSAVNVIEDMAKEAHFFSIGTNDLIQYTLAVDRTNEKVADLYIPHHPAILRSIKRVADAALARGIEVAVCGDMANDSRYIPFLLGVGINTLSIDSAYLPRIKKLLAKITMDDSRKIAELMLSQSRLSELDRIIEKAEEMQL